MKFEQIHAVQDWLPFEKILDKGIIKLKDSSYIKILKIKPINYNLKSELEKEAILNSYKNFIKSCNFNLQILIQSKKEDLSKHLKKINEINFTNSITYDSINVKKPFQWMRDRIYHRKDTARRKVLEKVFLR